MNKLKTISKIILPAVIFALPAIALAVSAVDTGLQSSGLQLLFPLTGPGGATSVTGLIARVIQILLLIAGAVAVLYVVIGGFYWMTAQGNDEQAEKGQKTLTNALIGIVVVILSYVVVNVIVNLVSGNSLLGI